MRPQRRKKAAVPTARTVWASPAPSHGVRQLPRPPRTARVPRHLRAFPAHKAAPRGALAASQLFNFARKCLRGMAPTDPAPSRAVGGRWRPSGVHALLERNRLSGSRSFARRRRNGRAGSRRRRAPAGTSERRCEHGGADPFQDPFLHPLGARTRTRATQVSRRPTRGALHELMGSAVGWNTLRAGRPKPPPKP